MVPSPDWNRTQDALGSILSQYADQLVAARWELLGLVAATVSVMLLWNTIARRATREGQGIRRWELVLEITMVVLAVGVGLWLVVARASLVDDAFISFRYSKNFADGYGLVFNLDERVEGYTNFLWTFLIGLVVKLTPAEAPIIGLWACIACFSLNLIVVWRIGRVLAQPYSPGLVFPLAVCLLAVQFTFTIFGTSGLETGCASLLVNLGALHLITARADGDDLRPLWAGLFLILATMTRPDHALFYAVGSLVVFTAHVRGVWTARRDGARALWRGGLRPMALYAAPFLLYAGYMAWKISYYGDVLPNTYYAKSAALSYFEQGVIYAAIFHLASQLWLAIPMLGVWLAVPSRDGPTRRFKAFAIPSVLLYELYVMKVGGDFMHGRFYVTIMPLMLLGCAQLVLALGSSLSRKAEAPPRRGSRWPAFIVAPLLVATAGELPFFTEKEPLFYVVQEANFYSVTDWSPVTVNHSNFRAGRALGDLRAKGVELTVATSGIGMLGYNSQVPVIDILGLTNAHVAHQPLTERGRPGHEKRANKAYITERNPHLVRGPYVPRRRRPLTKIVLGKHSGNRWYIWHYDREIMREIRAVNANVKFRDFEKYLDRYIRSIHRKKRKTVLRDLRWFKAYYFNHNDDPERLEKIQNWLIASKREQ